jgi:hypothetical protein
MVGRQIPAGIFQKLSRCIPKCALSASLLYYIGTHKTEDTFVVFIQEKHIDTKDLESAWKCVCVCVCVLRARVLKI